MLQSPSLEHVGTQALDANRPSGAHRVPDGQVPPPSPQLTQMPPGIDAKQPDRDPTTVQSSVVRQETGPGSIPESAAPPAPVFGAPLPPSFAPPLPPVSTAPPAPASVRLPVWLDSSEEQATQTKSVIREVSCVFTKGMDFLLHRTPRIASNVLGSGVSVTT
jgi:hypothetical protein